MIARLNDRMSRHVQNPRLQRDATRFVPLTTRIPAKLIRQYAFPLFTRQPQPPPTAAATIAALTRPTARAGHLAASGFRPLSPPGREQRPLRVRPGSRPASSG